MNTILSESTFRRLSVSEMEARIPRFEERVGAAQRSVPATKQWVRDALRRRGTGRSPVRLKRLSLDIVLRYGDAWRICFANSPTTW